MSRKTISFSPLADTSITLMAKSRSQSQNEVVNQSVIRQRYLDEKVSQGYRLQLLGPQGDVIEVVFI